MSEPPCFFFHPINHTARSHASHGLAAVDAPTTRNVPSDLSDESLYRAVRWSLVTQPCRLKGTRSLGLILWTRDTPRGGGSPRAEEVLCCSWDAAPAQMTPCVTRRGWGAAAPCQTDPVSCRRGDIQALKVPTPLRHNKRPTFFRPAYVFFSYFPDGNTKVSYSHIWHST